MIRFILLGIDALPAALVLVPGILLLQGRGLSSGSAGRKLWLILFAVYLAGVLAAVGIPNAFYVRFDPAFNLIPVLDIVNDPVGYIKNTLLNILLFLPLGFFLPVLWEEFRSVKKTTIFGFGLSLLVETLQIFTFRLTDVDDLLTNTAGAALGCALACLVLPKLGRLLPKAPGRGGTRELALVGGLVFLTMFFVQPVLNQFIWDTWLSGWSFRL